MKTTGAMTNDFQKDIAAVQKISAVPTILDIVCQSTGMGFAAVARVTEDRWIACQVLDNVNFGLPAGGELQVETTLCHEIRQHRQVVAIDNVAQDLVYSNHHTPRIYGLQSYISVPILLPDGRFFGTLCAIHTEPASLNNAQTINTFKLFAELIAYHLDASDQLKDARKELVDERELSELREQFIAVMGHDLRNPIAALGAGTNRLIKDGWTERSPMILQMMKASLSRMAGLVENVMDLARARLGGGIVLILDPSRDIALTLNQVIEELRAAQPDRVIETHFNLEMPIAVDHQRLAQMFSNLLANALTHGAENTPVRVWALTTQDGFMLQVANAGEPISDALMEKLFQPFHRGDANPHMGGLGLGLYIASEIARAHGGTISVASDEAETRFTFAMPRQ
jgi:signal transduction histidine kinase